jgi:hypothetical protein
MTLAGVGVQRSINDVIGRKRTLSLINGVSTSTRNIKQRGKMAYKRRKGEGKPFLDCEECLFTSDNCTICNVVEGGKKYPLPEGFVDRTILHLDEFTEMVGEVDAIPNIPFNVSSASSRRAVTHAREGVI